MKLKKLLLGTALAALTTITLSSCGGGTTRNTVTPYGTLNSKLNDTIATADNNLTMTVGQYYTQLRKNGYDVITNAINKNIYKDEYTVTKALFENATRADFINSLGKDKLSMLEYTDEKDESKTAQSKLFDLTTDSEAANDKYLSLRKKLVKAITTSISSDIFGASSAKSISKLTDEDISKDLERYVDTLASEGIYIETTDIKYDLPTDTTYFNDVDDLVTFTNSTFEKLSSKIESYILQQAKYLAGRRALYKIADEEYVYDEDSENDVKNSNYLFKDKQIKDYYENNYKNHGEYKAIIIQFNSRKDAMEAINSLKNDPVNPVDFNNIQTLDEAKEAYLRLYNYYYDYKNVASADDDAFDYVVNKDKDELNDLSSDISVLIKSTLENGEFLKEPRNINNKYVMALHISTDYTYNAGDSTKQAELDSFDEEKRVEIENTIKEDILFSTISYSSTVDNERFENAKIKIYDPYFENSFYNSYSDSYELVTSTIEASSNDIFTIGDYKYTVEDFYNDASKKYANTIITNYFELEFAKSYYEKYVSLYLIDSDLASDNETTLDEAIGKFNNNENSTYPKEVGLETYLLGTYGYTNKSDVLEYYYKATKALSTYNSMMIYDSWRSSGTNADGQYYLSEDAENSFLKNLLATGNNNYSDIFSINLDHMLINIDDDDDGNPDDPDDFLFGKTDEEKEAFENAVIKLARAIYLESINTIYKNSTIYETLLYIKTQYEEGNKMNSPFEFDNNGTVVVVDNWDDFKKLNKYNFLLTIEKLASSDNITESSVSNFVVPFKKYVINLYKSVSSMNSTEDPYRKTDSSNSDTYEYENGKYFLYNTATKTGTFATDEADAALITKDTLCKTSFGYHILLINSYDKKDYLTYTDASEYQKNIELVLRTYTDSDDKTQNITLNISSVNETTDATEASFNQFFIYYVQKNTGASTSLDTEIYSLMEKLFSDTITNYSSSTFQKYLLDSKLNIKFSTETEILTNKVFTANLTKLKNTFIGYDKESKYISWVDGTLTWTRPEI